MAYIKDKPKNQTEKFNPKDTIFVFFSFSLVCMAIILVLIVYDVFTMENFLSFHHPLKIVMNVVFASFGLLLYGVILTLLLPSKYIEDSNQSYHTYSFLTIFSFMFLGALFEEILFRGIIQNLLFELTEYQWAANILTTILFLGIHTQYFKKPLMLINITVPSLIFGWIYFETSNILVPFFVHLLMNLGMTLLFKYNLLRVKETEVEYRD
jgi:uncharacterized protein